MSTRPQQVVTAASSALQDQREDALSAPSQTTDTNSGRTGSANAVTLALSQRTCDRLCSAAALLRVSPDALICRLLSDFHNALGGLPTDIILFVFAFLDYSTLASVVSAVSKRWATVLQRDPAQHASTLRQVHGVHLLDPVRGIFFFPRALKRVQMGADGAGRGAGAGNKPAGSVTSGVARDGAGGSGAASSSFSFLTVDIRTQDVRSLPWASVKHIVRQAVEHEKMLYGVVRTPSLQKPENPVLMQSAMVTHERLIYMFGGQTYEGVVVNRCFCYNPQAKRWRSLPPLRERRASATAAVLMGKAYIFGGYGEDEQVLDTYEVFDLATATWDRPPALSFLPRASSTSGVVTHATSTPINNAPCRRDRLDDHADYSIVTQVRTSVDADADDRPTMGNTPAVTTTTATPDPHDRAVDPGPFRMPERLCGTAAVAYKDVFLFVGGFRQYIAPTDTAVHYSSVSSIATTPLNPNSARQRIVPSMSTSSMDAAAAAAFAEVASESGTSSHAGPVRTTTSTTATTVTNTAHSSGAVRVAVSSTRPMYSESSATPPPAPSQSLEESAAEGRNDGMPATVLLGQAPTRSTNGTEGEGQAGEGDDRPEPLLPLPRRPSLSLDGPSCAETCVWVFSPRLQRWWLHGPALPSPRAFGSAAVLTFPGTLGTCLCYFGGCTSADQPEMSMLYIPLNEDTTMIGSSPGSRVCQSFLTTPEASAQRMASPTPSRHAMPSTQAVMYACFRDPRRLRWHRHLRIPLGGAFTSVATIGKDSARSVVLSAFYPTPNIGFCHVSRVLPADLCARPEWQGRGLASPADFVPGSASSRSSADEQSDDEDAEDEEVAVSSRADDTTRATRPLSHQSMRSTSSSSPPTDASSPALPPVVTGAMGPTEEADEAVVGVHRPTRLDPTLLRVRGQGNNVSGNGSTFSAVATPVRMDQRRDVQQLLRTAVDAASQHRPRDPQTVGSEHQWHLAPLSEVKVRDDITGRPLLNRVSWRIQALNAKPIVPIE